MWLTRVHHSVLQHQCDCLSVTGTAGAVGASDSGKHVLPGISSAALAEEYLIDSRSLAMCWRFLLQVSLCLPPMHSTSAFILITLAHSTCILPCTLRVPTTLLTSPMLCFSESSTATTGTCCSLSIVARQWCMLAFSNPGKATTSTCRSQALLSACHTPVHITSVTSPQSHHPSFTSSHNSSFTHTAMPCRRQASTCCRQKAQGW